MIFQIYFLIVKINRLIFFPTVHSNKIWLAQQYRPIVYGKYSREVLMEILWSRRWKEEDLSR